MNQAPVPYRIPVSTYRLQFHKGFTFRDAAAIIPYLHELGITDCYASPYLMAVPGSMHGYDVIDPTSLNPEIGSQEDYQIFLNALSHHQMGHILDIVPNHMGIALGWNAWWQDVLENGPCSRYAEYFDIDWHPVKDELENKVLLPILGDQYGIVLENQEIALRYQDGQFFVQYYEQRLPLDPASWVAILSYRLDELVGREGASDIHIQELQSINTALFNLPKRNEHDAQRIAERYREIEVIKRRLSTVGEESAPVREFIQHNLVLFNGTKGVPHSFDLLDALLSDQAYRLAFWRVAAEEINYRRFFDINELAAIRMEDPRVFRDVHGFVCELLSKGCISGLRVDHVDGLYEPRSYLRQWQDWAHKELGWPADAKGRAMYLLVEKILGKGETLSDLWPIHGTSGYEFLALLNNFFVDSTHKRAFDELYAKFVKSRMSFDDLIYENKILIMNSSMASEINSLGHMLNVLSEKNRRSRDFTLNNLTDAIQEIIACFPVYRTYVTPDPEEPVTDRDRAYIRLAVTKAKRRNPAMNTLVFDFIQDLLLKVLDETAKLLWSDVHPFVMKFQQTTSPVTAKGVEDTACYVYNRLISLNEVGDEPAHFGLTLSAFHERLRDRQERWPLSLSTTSTHDTKRSEDVRARLNVLSEMPHEWKRRVTKWHRLNRKLKLTIDDQPAPDRNDEYFLYQTLLGAWPLGNPDSAPHEAFQNRILGYMSKALKEAKVHSSWINPHEAYEHAVDEFVRRLFDRASPNPFLDDFLPFQKKIAYFGMLNSLVQLALKLTAPGIPDIYQGSELWNLTLVDPDNRQAVDYEHRHVLLKEVKNLDPANAGSQIFDWLRNWKDGRIKLFFTTTLLQYRRAHPNLFWEGAYLPLESFGEKSDHICGFERRWQRERLIVIVGRFFSKLCVDDIFWPPCEDVWSHTGIVPVEENAAMRYKDILTGQMIAKDTSASRPLIPAREIFQHVPIAILEPCL